MLEGTIFRIYANKKTLTYDFRKNPQKYSSRPLRRLDYVSQYSTNITHVQGSQKYRF